MVFLPFSLIYSQQAPNSSQQQRRRLFKIKRRLKQSKVFLSSSTAATNPDNHSRCSRPYPRPLWLRSKSVFQIQISI